MPKTWTDNNNAGPALQGNCVFISGTCCKCIARGQSVCRVKGEVHEDAGDQSRR